jgi:hypothetical protein
MYDSVEDKKSDWREDVPEGVGKIIVDNWDVIEKYSKLEDKTRRVLGMKFPIEGWSE